MRNFNKHLFYVGILMYIIYYKIFYTLSSLNELLLMKLNFSETLYSFGFIIVAIITSISIFLLYKSNIANRIVDRKTAIKFTILLLIVLSINFTIGRYLTILGEQMSNEEIFLKQIANYDLINLIFFIQTFLWIAFLFIRIIKDKSNNNLN